MMAAPDTSGSIRTIQSTKRTLMDELKKNKLVAAWILAQEEEDDDASAIQAFALLPNEDPELCWELILRIHAEPISEEVRAILAASPLEDLLVYHGKEYFPRVKAIALKDPLFRKMLSGVWLDQKKSPIWREFYELAGVKPKFS